MASGSTSGGNFTNPIQAAQRHLPLLTFAALLASCALAPGAFASAPSPSDLTPVLPHLSPIYDLAENEQEFFSNVARYGRYFVTVMLGTGYVMLRPIAGMFKNPVTAVLGIALVVGAVVGTKVTLDAMLGLSDQVLYESANFM